MKLGVYRQIFGNTQIQHFMKIRLVGDELFHEDGRIDRHDEANSGFSKFCEGAYTQIPPHQFRFGTIIAVYFEDRTEHECRIC